MFDCWRYILPMLPLSFSEKEKLGEPKKEIGNLKMDLNICILVISKYNICNLNICILVILRYNISNLNILRIHISYFRGHDTLPWTCGTMGGVTCGGARALDGDGFVRRFGCIHWFGRASGFGNLRRSQPRTQGIGANKFARSCWGVKENPSKWICLNFPRCRQGKFYLGLKTCRTLVPVMVGMRG
jgi:hypothetical protein